MQWLARVDIREAARQCERALKTIELPIAIVGGGPAGLAAAIEAARAGLTVHLYDERDALGGPIYAHAARTTLLAELDALGSRIVVHRRATVWGVFDARTLAIFAQERADTVRAEILVLATGSHARRVPVPGQTLRGVSHCDDLDALLHTTAARPGLRVLVAGAGPSLAPIAARLSRAGAHVVSVLDAAGGRESATESTMPRAIDGPWRQWPVSGDAAADSLTLRAARVPYRAARTGARIEGDETARAAITVALDDAWTPIPGTEESLDVDAVCFAWGAVPASELAAIAGAERGFSPERGGVAAIVSADMETSVRGVFAVGDAAGGAALSTLEGRIAGVAAAMRLGALGKAEGRDRLRIFRSALAPLVRARAAAARVSAIRPGLAALATPDTVLCPCESTTAARVDQAVDEGARDLGHVKRATRAGMGPCQGRACAPAIADRVALRLGHSAAAVPPLHPRPPVTPVPIRALATLPEE